MNVPAPLRFRTVLAVMTVCLALAPGLWAQVGTSRAAQTPTAQAPDKNAGQRGDDRQTADQSQTAADDGQDPAGATPSQAPYGDVSVTSVQEIGADGKPRNPSSSNPLTYGAHIRLRIVGMNKLSPGDLEGLTLYLNGQRFDKVHPAGITKTEGTVDFKLPSVGGSRKAWKEILKDPPLDGLREVSVSMGFDRAEVAFPPTYPSNIPSITLRLLDGTMMIVFLVGIVILVGLFVVLAIRTDILRDDTLPPLDPKRRKPFSLAKTQAALWFLVIFCSFVFIGLVTGDIIGVLTPQALILLSIGAATTLGAAAVDASKSSTVTSQRKMIQQSMDAMKNDIAATQGGKATPEQNAEIARMEDAVRPASQNLIMDILTDKNGITLYRLQIVLWTVVLMAIFVVRVILDLTFPEFDSSLLALMGVSSGVYVGFKIPESQFEKPDPDQAQTPAEQSAR